MARHLLVATRQQGGHEPDGAAELQRHKDGRRVGTIAAGGRRVGRLHGLSPPGRKGWLLTLAESRSPLTSSWRLNNRAENSHLPFRRRERARQGFRSPGGLQRFVSVFSAVRNLFRSEERR